MRKLLLNAFVGIASVSIAQADAAPSILTHGEEKSLISIEIESGRLIQIPGLLRNTYGRKIVPIAANRIVVDGDMHGVDSLIEIDLETRTSRALGKGTEVLSFLPESETLIFAEVSTGPTMTIYEARASELEASKRAVLHFPRSPVDVWVVPRKGRDYLLVGMGSTVSVYGVTSSAGLQMLKGFEKCIPVAWRAATDQLICGDASGKRVWLGEASGKVTTEIGSLSGSKPLLYVKSLDALIYSKSGSWASLGEHKDTYVYFFGTGRSRLLGKDTGVSQRSGIIE